MNGKKSAASATVKGGAIVFVATADGKLAVELWDASRKVVAWAVASDAEETVRDAQDTLAYLRRKGAAVASAPKPSPDPEPPDDGEQA